MVKENDNVIFFVVPPYNMFRYSKFIRVLKFAKSSQVNSTSSFDMHVVGRNM